jgi:2-polyprenyl-3-methyl-5-hydroxy-6-metoxy-1,4-benzoquinol methylase
MAGAAAESFPQMELKNVRGVLAIKSLLLNILRKKRVALFFLPLVMKAHNALYDLAGFFAIAVNGGKHPKHHILRYQEWFRDHIDANWVVVDVGSNTGSMAALLAGKAHHVYGIEIIPQLSEIARKKYTNKSLEFITADATTFDYSKCQPIDCVTLSNVLEHIHDRIAFLDMLRRRLPWRNPAACTFLIRVPTIEREWLAVYKKELGIEYRLDRTHEIEHTQVQFCIELQAAGLEIESLDVRFGEIYAVCHGAIG